MIIISQQRALMKLSLNQVVGLKSAMQSKPPPVMPNVKPPLA